MADKFLLTILGTLNEAQARWYVAREAIALGENETRRLSDIIEAGQTSGWHSFEQSLLKAFEDGLITDETALLYCTNKSQMHQRVDAAKKRQSTSNITHNLKMRAEEPKPAPKPPAPPQMTPPPLADGQKQSP